MAIGATLFDPLVPNKLWVSDGIGVWNTTNLPTANFQWNTPVVWHDQSIGIEQLVANAIVVTTSGHPVLASQDRPFIYVDNPDAYASTYGPVMGKTIVAGWSLDYASSNPNFLVGIADYWGVEEFGLFSRWWQDLELFRKLPAGCRDQLHWWHDRRKLTDKHYMGASRRCAAILHPQWGRDLESHHSAGCFQLEWV